jgi:hypothetical protein
MLLIKQRSVENPSRILAKGSNYFSKRLILGLMIPFDRLINNHYMHPFTGDLTKN